MRLRWRIAPLLAVAALAACGTPQSEAPEADAPMKPAEVVTETPELDSGAVGLVRDRYIAAVNNGNLEEMMAVWTDDGVLMPPDEPALTGKDAIRAWYQGMLGRFDAEAVITSAETHILGDWGFDRGTYTLSLSPKAAAPVPVTPPAEGTAPTAPEAPSAEPAADAPPSPPAAEAPKPKAPAQTIKYLVLVKRDETGNWKVARNIWSFDAPAPPRGAADTPH